MRTVLALSLSSFLSLCAFAQSPPVVPEEKNPHNTAADRAAGAKMFRSHCGPCHGTRATGGTGPDLTTGIFYHGGTDADLYRNISNGIAGTAMPDVFFDGTQVWQLVAYVRSLSERATPATPPGDASHGEQLARAGVSESRLTRLLTARGDAFVQGLPPLLRLLGSKAIAPNWYELGRLILKEASPDPEDREDAEALRLRIAGAYFSAVARH